MFTMTLEWLKKNYGSHGDQQVRDAVNWLNQYGRNVPSDKINEWAQWKHLTEYQVNTEDIVEQALSRVGTEFVSELDAHRFLNRLRVPGPSEAYVEALEIGQPTTILELGVGGDSAISTAIFLSYIEFKYGRRMLSVDRNPLGVTWIRYKDVPFWTFIKGDSVDVMRQESEAGKWYDMVFIDTIHDYPHTMKELNYATKLTNFILMDDVAFEGNAFDKEPGGVKRAIAEWTPENSNWKYREFHGRNVGLMIRCDYTEEPKPKRQTLLRGKRR